MKNNLIFVIFVFILFVFVCGTQTYAATLTKTWTGSVAGDDVAATDTWNVTLTGDVNLGGDVIVKGTLIINTDGKGEHIIKRTGGSAIFRVESGGKMVIKGTSLSPVIIQGYQGTDGSYATITMYTGTMELDYVKIKGTRRYSGNGGAIQFGNGSAQTVTATITNSSIEDCRAPEGSAMMFLNNCGGNISINSSVITNCISNGSYCGTIRTQGSANCKLTITSCKITENVSNNNGGGVYWNARGSSASLTITGTAEAPTIISNNEAINGGGIFLSGSSISILHTQITNNIGEEGGGICMQPYDYGSTTTGKGCSLILGDGSIVKDNEATKYGGGIYMDIHSGSTTEHEDFSITVKEGSFIQGNKAPCGGAFAITQKLGGAENSVNNSKKYDTYVFVEGGEISNNISTVDGGAFYISREYGDAGVDFDLNIAISGGNIFNNKATNNGGAFYLADNASNGKAKVSVNGGEATSNIAVNGGAVYAYGGDFIMTGGALNNNIAYFGGGAVYVDNGNFVMNGGKISANIASGEASDSGYGGAVYISSGNATINGGSIENCMAKEKGGAIYLYDGNFNIISGNIGKLEDNKKLGSKASQGGAIYIMGGNFTMDGGTIEGNTATNSGGAIQINDGNVYITGGKISSNVARGEDENADVGYGGGIYVDGGQEVNITGGEISKNIAAKNGGGIEIKTDKIVTVDIYSGSFIDNVADECGGAVGIECDNGTINVGKVDCDGSSANGHIHPVLAGNLAGVQGGGFYMTGRDAMLNIYCGAVDNNIVVNIENNFDQSSGTVTVYEGVQIGEANEGIIVIGGTFIDKRATEEQKYIVKYYCNYNGSTEYKEALVSKDTMLTLPGDIFGIADYEIIGWTRDKNNTIEIEYQAGQTIEIVEEIALYAIWILEEKNEASYVVVIPTEVSFSDDVETMKFDIKATLTLFPRNRMLNVIVSEEEFILKLLENGLEKDEIKYELRKESEKVNPGDIIASFVADSALIDYEGREEIGITIIDNPKYVGYYKGKLTFSIEITE